MKLLSNNFGGSIVEVILGAGILGGTFSFFMKSVEMSHQHTVRATDHYEIQLIAESVANVVSTINQNQLRDTLESDFLDETEFYDKSKAAWLIDWEKSNKAIQSIKFRVDLYECDYTTSVSDDCETIDNKITSLPVNSDLEYLKFQEYEKKFSVIVDYTMGKSNRKIEYTKWQEGI